MDAPSAQLRNLLTDLQLVTSSQWRQCRGAVRAFARDLPAFDSVWIDGLVRIGAITLLQAEWLSNGQGENLAVGPYLLEKSAGRDELLFSCEGRHRQTRQRVRLTRLLLAGKEDRQEIHQRFQMLVSRSLEARKSSRLLQDLVNEVHEVGNAVWLISPLVEGVSAASLVVRRGRFPADVVGGIFVQLIQRLSAAEELGLYHGDLRPSHLLLTPAGKISLVQHGILNALIPEMTIYHKVPLEFLDGLAPERIRQPAPVSSHSEIYACGCLLWQLLTGRSPHLSADPLGKRSAQLKRRIPDVRELAPDVPEELALLILEMTAPEVNERPGSFRELAERVKSVSGPQERRIANFVKSFETASPHPWWQAEFLRAPKAPVSQGGRRTTTAAMVVVALASGFLARPYLDLKQVDEPVTGLQESPVTESHQHDQAAGVAQVSHSTENVLEPSSTILPLPDPGSDGVLHLEGGRVYRAKGLSFSGPLSVQAPVTKPALILIDEVTWEVKATALQLQGVEIRRMPRVQQVPLINIQAQLLQIDNCRFTGQGAGEASGVAISWTVLNSEEKTAARLNVQDTGFLQCGTAIQVNHPLMGAKYENVLKTGEGALLQLNSGVGPGYQVHLVLKRVTLCDSGPLIQLPIEQVERSGKLIIEGQDSALALSGENSLFLFEGALLEKDWYRHFEIAASGIVLREGTVLAGFRGTSGPSLARVVAPIETAELKVDGLLLGAFLFSGANLADPNECIAIAENIPLYLAGSPLGAVLDAFSVPDVPAPLISPAGEITTRRIAPIPFPNYNPGDVRE